MKEDIQHNLNLINERIENACLRSNRQRSEVQLLLATKTVPAERIKLAFECGELLMAENKVQEIKEKYEVLKSIAHTKHFIGYLQSNKIKDILKYDVSCIQSIDRLDLAEKLNQRLLFENKTMDIFVQVNTSYEDSKFGAKPEETLALVEQLANLEAIRIKGLMTIGLFSSEVEKVRKCFRLLKELQQKIKALKIPNVQVEELSMGMSGDLEIAIEEGATMVRVGTAIFGERIYPDHYYWDESKALK